MLMIDANIVLRYIINDQPEVSQKAKDVIFNNEIIIITQVIAEVIYVLEDVYKTPRQSIADALLSICNRTNVQLENHKIVACSLNEYRDTNLDFVDVLLYAYQKFTGEKVMTFDKKLNKKLNELL